MILIVVFNVLGLLALLLMSASQKGWRKVFYPVLAILFFVLAAHFAGLIALPFLV